MAEARAEYAAYFRALGERAARYDKTNAHYGRTLDYDPWCRVCGRATKAKGLCLTHYVCEYRKAARQRFRRRATTNTTCGHLDRKHHAQGRCHPCYKRVGRSNKKTRGGSTGFASAPLALRSHAQPTP